MKRIIVTVVYILSLSNLFAQKEYNIKAYGAKGDNRTYNTKSIQTAIDEAHKNGGGKVIIPAGYYLTAPIYLKSDVELHLSENAVLLGSTRRIDYGEGPASALIVIANQKHVSITGKGIIDGQGQDVVKDLFRLLQQGKIKDARWTTHRPDEANRPKIIEFKECENVTVKGITVKNGAAWIQDYIRCTNVIIDSVTVVSTTYWNNDGIDIVNSRNVKITNCVIDAADDAIVLKSESVPGICENIYVENCTLRSSASAFKLGTGSHGGFKNIVARNLKVFDTYRSAIALEAVDGGFIDGVDIQHVTAVNTGNAIFIKLGHRNKDDKYSTVKNIHISDVDAQIPAGKPDMGYPIEGPPLKYPHNVFPASISGLPGHNVENVFLENIKITYDGGGDIMAGGFAWDSLQMIPESPANYPEFSMFGELPCWGLFVRHASGVSFKNVTLALQQDDYRPSVIFDDVKELKLDGLNIPRCNTLPAVVFSRTIKPEDAFLLLPGHVDQAVRTIP